MENLVTLIGVRYTTGRYEAVHAIDMICDKLGRSGLHSRTHQTPVAGGAIADVEALIAEVTDREAGRLDAAVCRALVRNHGTQADAILKLIFDDPMLAEIVGDSTTLMAEVVHAVRAEMAMTLSDVVLRRTDLATGGYPGRAALEQVARWMARELEWSASETQDQLATVASRFPAWAVEAEANAEIDADMAA